jgi:hypothetical protein
MKDRWEREDGKPQRQKKRKMESHEGNKLTTLAINCTLENKDPFITF